MSGTASESALLATWRTRLAVAANSGGRPARADGRRHERLHLDLQRLMDAARTLVLDGKLSLPGLRPAKQLLSETLNLARLAVEELRRQSPFGLSALQLHTLTELVESVDQLIQRVAGQLQALTMVTAAGRQLHQVLGELQTSPQPTAHGLWELTDHLANTTESAKDCYDWLRLPGVSLADCLSDQAWPLAWFYVESIESARIAALAVGRAVELTAQERRLVIAALLLRDAGWTRLAPNRQRLDRHDVLFELRRRAMRHAGTGAALVAGMSHIPPRLPLIIGQHHERLDGSGYPAGVAAQALCPVSRWVIAGTRLQEILTARLRTAPTTLDGVLQQTGVELWRDVQYGRLDRLASVQLLEALQPGLALASEMGVDRQLQVEVDAAHALPAPHQLEPLLDAAAEGHRSEEPTISIRIPQFLRQSRGESRALVPTDPAAVLRLGDWPPVEAASRSRKGNPEGGTP